MNSRIAFLLSLALAGVSAAGNAQILGPQIVSSAPMAGPAQEYNPTVVSVDAVSLQLTAAQLDQLLGPIALYPDALVALILPAATEASDVVLAARFLGGEGATSIEEQPWDDSVKALAHYPSVVRWMDENLAWTKQVGDAFLEQPAEVMKSLQRLRAAARAAGTLVDTPEQQIVTEADVISIVPTRPDVIYVPYYDPGIVYLPRRDFNYPYYPSGGFFSFSIGYPTGFWLGYGLDWGHRRVWVIDRTERERYWRQQRDWRRPAIPSRAGFVGNDFYRPWSPDPAFRRPSRSPVRPMSPQIIRPTVSSTEPSRPAASYSISRDRSTDRAAVSRESRQPPPNTSRSPQSRIQNVQRSSAAAQASSPVVAQRPAPRAQSESAAPRAPMPAAAPPTVYSRGNREVQSGERAPSETHRHLPPPRSVASAASVSQPGAIAPRAPAPAAEAAPAVPRSARKPDAPPAASERPVPAAQRVYSRGSERR